MTPRRVKKIWGIRKLRGKKTEKEVKREGRKRKRISKIIIMQYDFKSEPCLFFWSGW